MAKASDDGLVTLDQAVEGLRKKLGDDGVPTTAAKAKVVRVPRLPVGMLAFDVGTGGGLPVGRITLIAGEKNCLAGDTMIDVPRDLTMHPRGIPIRDLVGQRPYVYAWADGRLVLRRASAVWCVGLRPVVRVRLAPYGVVVPPGRQTAGYRSGHASKYLPPLELVGTADHRVLLSDGMTWRQLGDLRPGDGLCSLYRRRYGPAGKRQFSMFRWTNGRLVQESRFVLSELHGDRPQSVHAHHLNENAMDERIENLEWADGFAHLSHHARKRFAEHGPQGFAKAIHEGRHPRGMAGKHHAPETRAKIAETMRAAHASGRHPNHTVIDVQPAGEIDVYDMNVPGADCFVANGVVVHNSCKTTLALLAVADWQRRCHRCFRYRAAHFAFLPRWAPWPCGCAEPRQQVAFWSDIEGVWDEAWALKCGIALEDLWLERPDHGEQAIDVFDSLIRTRDVGLAVADSLAQLTPMVEIESSAEDQQQGAGARLTNKFCRMVAAAVGSGKQAGLQRTVIWLNQVREKVGAMTRGPAYVEPGGHGQRFLSSLVVRLRFGGYEWIGVDKRKGVPPNRAADYSVSRFQIRASKVGPPGTEGEMMLAVQAQDEGRIAQAHFDDVDYVMKEAKRYGVIRQRAKKLRLVLGTATQDGGFAGDEEVGDGWLTDDALREALLTTDLLLATTRARVIAAIYQPI